MSYLVNNLHFIVIHVPIAMLLFSFLFDLAAVFLKKKDWHTAAFLCLIIGTLGAIAAVMTGPEESEEALVERHELFANMTMFLFIALSLIRLWFHFRKKKELGGNAIYLAAALVGVLLVSYTGHLGGLMVHPDKGGEKESLQAPISSIQQSAQLGQARLNIIQPLN
ncbi:DUF2231 domain-containing protein [Paenibacillus puldeungensis]|uniref:DUF2231 domain-containing protein n=1 Tax=Paenibacillus puldeungensis TaxID=696536 RepID=A0ABW3RZL0_9BACL